MFERKKTIIRNRLLLKGYRAELLDSLGFLEEIELPNNMAVTSPTSDSTARGVARSVKRNPTAQANARLEELIGHFDTWLKSDPVGQRWDLTTSLNKQVRHAVLIDKHAYQR
jgi:hypothetical protein